jgi:hypothetical protein
MHLPQEYWWETTLLEIASGVGTPLLVDAATKSRLFGIYARILVDVDMSGKLFNSILVEREGFSFPVEVQYERQPLFCSHCKNHNKRRGFKQQAPKFNNVTLKDIHGNNTRTEAVATHVSKTP